MTGTPGHRNKRNKSTGKQAGSPQPDTTGTAITEESTTSSTRSGEDTRRRGWFWHWNHVITQYAPLLGLKGVGLLNSYTVWTDRREESPHRGYAFPSQQSEADFYGEDRAELITINKILVALDLIEIRKEMVYRVDAQGRNWKVPHNFYRVKDQDEGVSLTTAQVMRVVELADKDRAVYRYLRKLFSPRFSPIDPGNVWHDILEEIRPTEVWQRLAARTERDETRASARSKAGHKARRTNDTNPVFSAPNGSDNPASTATVDDSVNDSSTGSSDSRTVRKQTSVAATNNGSGTSVAPANKGSAQNTATIVAPTNNGDQTSVAQTNTTYHQSKTTTTIDQDKPENPGTGGESAPEAPSPVPTIPPVTRIAEPGPPDAGRDEDRAVRCFEEANNRASTMAERRLLRGLAANFEEPASATGVTGWRWVGDAIDEAVDSGSRFVAPKRIREILNRWQVEGREGTGVGRGGDTRAQAARQPVTSVTGASHRSPVAPVETAGPPEPFTIEELGKSSRVIWNAALRILRDSPDFGRAGAGTWLRDAHLIGRGDDGAMIVGVGNALALRRLAGRYPGTIRAALREVTGLDVPVEIVDYREWRDDDARHVTGANPA